MSEQKLTYPPEANFYSSGVLGKSFKVMLQTKFWLRFAHIRTRGAETPICLSGNSPNVVHYASKIEHSPNYCKTMA